MAAEAKAQVDDVTETYAGLIEASASSVAPVKYGILRASLAVEGAVLGALIAARRIIVGAFYGLFQHEGTKRGIEGNPFLTDAVKYWARDYVSAVGLAVRGGW